MKRFTATEKWDKPWYQGLSPKLKCLWQYICDKADSAGVWELNFPLASFQIGEKVSDADLKHFGHRVRLFGGNKLVVDSFLEFQYGKLSGDCKAHVPIFRAIEKHSLSIGYQKAIHSLQETETEKDKEEDKETEGDSKGGQDDPSPPAPNKARGTQAEVTEFCRELGLPESDAIYFFNKCEGSGWRNGSNAIKDWRATIRSWKHGGYMPSQKAAKGGYGGATATERAVAADREKTYPLHPAELDNILTLESIGEAEQ